MAKEKGGAALQAEAGQKPQGADELFDSRAQALLADFELDITTIGGGLREFILCLFKERPKPWDAMLEDEQRSIAKGINLAVDEALSEACLMIAQQGQHAIHAKLDKFTGKGGKYQAALLAHGGPEMAMELAKLDGKTVLIVDADSRAFAGGPDIGTAPDQRPMEFDEPEAQAQGGGEDISLDPGEDEELASEEAES